MGSKRKEESKRGNMSPEEKGEVRLWHDKIVSPWSQLVYFGKEL